MDVVDEVDSRGDRASGDFCRCQWILTALALLGLCLLASTAWSTANEELIRVRMEALAPGKGIEARHAAILEAERRIVDQVLIAALAPERLRAVRTLSQNPDPYIRSTQLLRYETLDADTRVEVECYVLRKAILRDAARRLRPEMPVPPTVLVLIAERVGKDGALSVAKPGPVETEIASLLRKADLDVVDSETVRSCQKESALLLAIQGDTAAAGAFARQAFAETVVLSESTFVQTAEGGSANVIESRVRATVRVLRARDGKCLDTYASEAVVHGAHPAEGRQAAVEDACARLAEDLEVACILGAAGLAPSDDVLITVEQPGTRERFDELLKAAAEAASGGEVEALFYSDALARLRVCYTGPMGPFIERLKAHKYAGAGFDPFRVLQRAVRARFTQ